MQTTTLTPFCHGHELAAMGLLHQHKNNGTTNFHGAGNNGWCERWKENGKFIWSGLIFMKYSWDYWQSKAYYVTKREMISIDSTKTIVSELWNSTLTSSPTSRYITLWKYSLSTLTYICLQPWPIMNHNHNLLQILTWITNTHRDIRKSKPPMFSSLLSYTPNPAFSTSIKITLVKIRKQYRGYTTAPCHTAKRMRLLQSTALLGNSYFCLITLYTSP